MSSSWNVSELVCGPKIHAFPIPMKPTLASNILGNSNACNGGSQSNQSLSGFTAIYVNLSHCCPQSRDCCKCWWKQKNNWMSAHFR